MSEKEKTKDEKLVEAVEACKSSLSWISLWLFIIMIQSCNMVSILRSE